MTLIDGFKSCFAYAEKIYGKEKVQRLNKYFSYIKRFQKSLMHPQKPENRFGQKHKKNTNQLNFENRFMKPNNSYKLFDFSHSMQH